MMRWIIGAVGLVSAFVVYCALVISSRADDAYCRQEKVREETKF